MKPRGYVSMCGVFACLLAVAAASALAARKPNIVVILSDDMGYSDLGCYGGEIQTPNLDRLAANGLRFTQFYNTARCCPTRASLLTGLYPHQAGVGHMIQDRGREGYQGELNRNCLTIAEALKPAGYRAYAVGKWHVARNLTQRGSKYDWPLQRGFDRYYGTITGAGSYFDPGTLTRDNTSISALADPEYAPAHYYYTDAISDQAVRFIAEHQRGQERRPFFLYVAYTAAHWPLHAKESDIARYRGRYDAGYEPIRLARFERQKQLGLIDPNWRLSPAWGDWSAVPNKDWEARCMEVYAAQIDCMDQGVGRIVAELRQQGQLEQTLIFFLQDNGGCAEGVGRDGRMTRPNQPTLPPIPPETPRLEVRPAQTRAGFPMLHGPDIMPGPADTFIAYGKAWANVSDTPFREYKHWVHEGGIATPLIIHWPRGFKDRGELRRQPGHLIDIMATCLAVAGARYPAEREGHKITPLPGLSLVPAFKDKPLSRGALFWEHEGNRAVRVGNWKLVARSPAGPWELYDLDKDRTEMDDLASRQTELVRKLAVAWEAWARGAHVIPWIWRPPYGHAAAAGPTPGDEPETEDSPLAGRSRFVLSEGDDLPRAVAPRLAGRAFTITAEVVQTGAEGVLVAQGGRAEGFSLYVKEGNLVFAIRRAGRLSVVTSTESWPAQAAKVAAQLSADGAVTLSTDGKPVASGKVPGPLLKLPGEGLQVGCDEDSPVGEYESPFAFRGKLGQVVLELN